MKERRGNWRDAFCICIPLKNEQSLILLFVQSILQY
jgi:hypothetical protein